VLADRCPLDGKPLREIDRVTERRVPATVPDWFSRAQEAPYARTDSWVEVECPKGHRFKRKGNGLYAAEEVARCRQS
jgi:hypothetical protein